MLYQVHFKNNQATYAVPVPAYSRLGNGLRQWKGKVPPYEFIWICVEAKSEEDAITKAREIVERENG